MLHRRRVELSAYLGEETLTLVAIVVEYAHLDELVRREVDVDLMQHRSGEPIVADADHGLQTMRFRPERSPLCRC